jgi:CheY-like chemotaxis protein
VLVAEDNPINAMVIESLLRKLGLTMTLAKNGQQAVQAIAQDPTNKQKFDLILMDLQMPELDGYGATQRIRQWETDSNQPRLPIIALTADAFEENHRHCLAVGMDDFLTKPVSIDALKSTLAKWLPTTAAAQVQSSVRAVRVSVDLQAFAALVSELTPLLAQNRFSAINRFKSLQAVVEGTDLADEINALDALLQEMRFDLVLERLTRIAASQEPA